MAILIRLGKSVTGQDKSNDKTDEYETKYVHFDLEVVKLTLYLVCDGVFVVSVTVSVKTNVSSVITFGIFNNSVIRQFFLDFPTKLLIRTCYKPTLKNIIRKPLSVHANCV